MDIQMQDKMTAPLRVQSNSDFWVAWILANWVASLAARWVLDGFRAYDQLSGSHIPVPLDGLAAGATIGIVAGILQWLMLRRQIYQTDKWAIATFLGWSIGMTVGWPLLKMIGGVPGEIVSFAVAGLVIGLLQWLTLRAQVDHAGWWIPTSGIAWATGLYIVGWIIAGWVFIRLWQQPKEGVPITLPIKSATDPEQIVEKPRSAPSRQKQDLILIAQWSGLGVLGQFVLFFASGPFMIFFILARNSPVLMLIIMAVMWAIVGALIGLLQSFVLRKHFPRLRQWMLFTVLGWVLSGEIIGLLIIADGGVGFTLISASTAGAGIGLLIGTAQWVVLRGNVRKSFLWILANILGGAIGGVAGFPIVGLFLITIGIATSLLLVWFLRHPVSKNSKPQLVVTV